MSNHIQVAYAPSRALKLALAGQAAAVPKHGTACQTSAGVCNEHKNANCWRVNYVSASLNEIAAQVAGELSPTLLSNSRDAQPSWMRSSKGYGWNGEQSPAHGSAFRVRESVGRQRPEAASARALSVHEALPLPCRSASRLGGTQVAVDGT